MDLARAGATVSDICPVAETRASRGVISSGNPRVVRRAMRVFMCLYPTRLTLSLLAFAVALPGTTAAQEAAAAGASAAHAAPRDTVGPAEYEGWKQFSLHCARCHGEDALGTSFGPNLVAALRPDGTLPSREAFLAVLVAGRPDKGMPSSGTLGLGPEYHAGLYEYLHGRSSGRLAGGRPARRER